MKKLAIMTVRGVLGLLPSAIKTSLKKNSRLTEFYSRSLRKSGLLYGFPSAKKLQAMYKDCLAQQQRLLADVNPEPIRCNVVITGTNAKDVRASLNALLPFQSQVVNIFLDPEVLQKIASGEYAQWQLESYETLHKLAELPLLAIHAGDKVDMNTLCRVLSSELYTSESAVCYFDWHYLDKKGKLANAQLLPDWNPDLQLSTGYVHTAIWLPSPQSVFAQCSLKSCDYDLAVWFAAIALERIIVPYHMAVSVLARNSAAKSVTPVQAIAEKLAKQAAPVANTKINTVQALWPLVDSPKVSLIIPTYNGQDLVRACVTSILEKTTYHNYEILLVDNNSNDPECLAYFDELDKHPKVRLLKYPHPFNYSAINNFAVKHAKGEVVGLVNNDIEVITPEWLEYMAGHAMREDIGCVGAKLLYSDGRIQHAGVVLGYGGGAGHAHKYFPRYHPGYMKRLIATQNYSAVTAACLLVRKSKFEEVGGLNEDDLQVAFNDVDFCLRVLETGVRNLYCAEAELYHHESVSRGLDITPEKAARFNRELNYLQTRWKKYIDHDPAYNPNLTRKRENFAIKGKDEY